MVVRSSEPLGTIRFYFLKPLRRKEDGDKHPEQEKLGQTMELLSDKRPIRLFVTIYRPLRDGSYSGMAKALLQHRHDKFEATGENMVEVT